MSVREERRRLVENILLAEPERSNRSIARACGCSHELPRVVRAELESAGRIAPRSADETLAVQPHGGRLTRGRLGEPSPTLQHGCYSMARLDPRANELFAELRQHVPGAVPADEPAIRLLALTLARVEAGAAWLDERGLFRDEKRGEPWPIIKSLSGWETTAARLCDQLGLTPTSRARLGLSKAGHDGYAQYLQMVQSGNGGEDSR